MACRLVVVAVVVTCMCELLSVFVCIVVAYLFNVRLHLVFFSPTTPPQQTSARVSSSAGSDVYKSPCYFLVTELKLCLLSLLVTELFCAGYFELVIELFFRRAWA